MHDHSLHSKRSLAAPQAALRVNVKEWSMRTSARSVGSGAAAIVLRNTGLRTHVIALVRTNRAAGALPLKAGLPQLGRVIAKLKVEPGKTLRFTRRLAPGKYVLACALRGHYAHGMHAGFRVVAAAPAAPSGQTLELATAGMFKFDRSVLRATAGRVTIVFTNKEKLPHNVGVRGKGGLDLKSAVVGEGTTVRLTVQLAAGTYTFYCSVPGHEGAGMRGTLTVTAAKGPPGSPPPPAGPPAPTPPADPVAPPPPAPAGSISIRAVNFTSFDVTSATAAAGPMTLALVNETPLPHNIALRGPGVSVEGPVVGQNGISTISVTLAPGTYTFYCSVAGHEAAGMRGTLTVGSGGGGVPAPPPGPPPGSPPPVNPPPPGTGTVLELTTAGSVAFDKTSLTAPAGEVTLRLTNTVSLDHNIALRGNGIDLNGSVVGNGGVSSVTANLAAGTYTFYCAVGGHEGAGMRGTLTVTGGGGGSPPPTNPPPGGGGASTATVTVTNGYSFDQRTVRVKAGLVELVLENRSSQWHGIAIKSHGVDVRGPVVGPGGTSRVSVFLEPHEYEFYCLTEKHRWWGMRGTLIVE